MQVHERCGLLYADLVNGLFMVWDGKRGVKEGRKKLEFRSECVFNVFAVIDKLLVTGRE